MLSNLDGTSQIFLANVNRIQQKFADANRQISSGLKISQASDAPDQISPLLQLKADQAHNQQIESNLTLAQSDAQTADSTLSAAIQLLDRAVTLGTEGATSTLSDTARQRGGAFGAEGDGAVQELDGRAQRGIGGLGVALRQGQVGFDLLVMGLVGFQLQQRRNLIGRVGGLRDLQPGADLPVGIGELLLNAVDVSQ